MPINTFTLDRLSPQRARGEFDQGPKCFLVFQKLQQTLKSYLFDQGLQAHQHRQAMSQFELHENFYTSHQMDLDPEDYWIYWGARPSQMSPTLSKAQWFQGETHLSWSAPERGLWTWWLKVPGSYATEDLLSSLGEVIEERSLHDLARGIPVSWGPEYLKEKHGGLTEGLWRVAQDSNVMGMRLERVLKSPASEHPEVVSSPVFPGVIQWSPQGPILLGPQCQTHGGYARAAWIAEDWVELMIQLRPGQVIKFRETS